MPTISCYLSHCAAHTSLMVYSYSHFSPAVTLITIQGQRWSSSHFTRARVSHLSYFLGIFMELCVLYPMSLPCFCLTIYSVSILFSCTYFFPVDWMMTLTFINIWRINVHLSWIVTLLASQRIISRNIWNSFLCKLSENRISLTKCSFNM